MLYVPVSFVRPVETTPVAVFVATMLTPGISAFALSETVPLTVALLDWLNVSVAKLMQSRAAARTSNCRIVFSSLPHLFDGSIHYQIVFGKPPHRIIAAMPCQLKIARHGGLHAASPRPKLFGRGLF